MLAWLAYFARDQAIDGLIPIPLFCGLAAFIPVGLILATDTPLVQQAATVLLGPK